MTRIFKLTFLLAQKKSNKRKQPAETTSRRLRGRARVLARPLLSHVINI